MIRGSNPHFRLTRSDTDLDPYPDPDVCPILLSAWVISPNIVKNRPAIVWEMPIDLLKYPIVEWDNAKMIRIVHTGPDKHQNLTTSRVSPLARGSPFARESPLARAYQVWSTSVSSFASYPVHKMRQTDRQTDKKTDISITLIRQPWISIKRLAASIAASNTAPLLVQHCFSSCT